MCCCDKACGLQHAACGTTLNAQGTTHCGNHATWGKCTDVEMWRGVYPAGSGAHVGILDSGNNVLI